MSEISSKYYLYGDQELNNGTIVSGGLLLAGIKEDGEVVGGGSAASLAVSLEAGSGVVISALGVSSAPVEFNKLYQNGGIAIFSGAVNVSALTLGSNASAIFCSGATLCFPEDEVMSSYGSLYLNGGRVQNSEIGEYGGWMIEGSLNFDLSGLTASASPYVASYNNVNKDPYEPGAAEAFTITVTTDGTIGDYILFGDASEFSTRSQSITVNGNNVPLNATYVDVVNCRAYALTQDASSNVVLSVATFGGEYCDETGVVDNIVGGNRALGTWDNGFNTTYNTGKNYIGNCSSGILNTILFIDNEGASEAASTYVIGGSEDGMDIDGEIDVRLYQGSIGAIMGGAAEATYYVGAVDIQVGGGTTTATTSAIYGAGYGDVKGNVKITTSNGAIVTGQVYGGPMVFSGNAATVSGEIELDLKGGTIGSDVVGGARVQADGSYTTSVEQRITIDVNGAELTGGADTCIYGAGWVVGKEQTAARAAGYDYRAKAVLINVNSDVAVGTASGRGIFGGALASDYAVANVDYSATINVEGCTVESNIYGGGWAQSGARSDVQAVWINVTDATVGSIYGGGSHGNLTYSTVAGSTYVSEANITISNSTVDMVCAVGQAEGDTVGTGYVNITGASTIGYAYGVGYQGAGKDANAFLQLRDFTGSITEAVVGFDTVSITDNSTATIAAGAEVKDNAAWTFSFGERTLEADQAALTWENGEFGTAEFTLYLNTTATAWTVCDLSGDDVKADAFDDVSFTIIDGTWTMWLSDYMLGTEITGTGTVWDGWKLDYDKTSGILAFSQLA